PKPDLSFSGLEEFVNEPIVVRKNNGAPIIEDWVSDSKEKDVPQAKIEKKTVKPSFAKIEFFKSKEQVKSPRKITVKQGPINKNTSLKNSNFNHRVNTVKDKNVNATRPKVVVNDVRPKAVLNAVKGNQVNAVKASACWVCVRIKNMMSI
ncbi:hypothetical protein Tco_1231287, partial [Tanacetum coccineum]